MAEERLVIVVDERGARVVQRNLENIGAGARRSGGGVQLLRRALGALAGAAVIRSLVRTADAFTNIQNRLRLVTESTAQLNTVQNELLRISNGTRTAFETNADLFNRLALSTRELGLTQRDVLELTESLNQAVIISGASATEASAGLIQLSQGLASGALRGDELRSVLEQLPAVADVIATELGVTRGRLRELGQQGAITADVVTRAFANARTELADRFGQTVPTIGQAFQTLRNNLVNFVGRVAEAIGFTGGLAQIIQSLGTRVGNLTESFVNGALAVREFVEVATVGITNFVQSAVPALQRFGQEFVKVFAAITGDEDLFIEAFNRQDELTDNIAQIRAQLDDEFDIIARNAEARRAAANSTDDATLDLQIPGGSGAAAIIDELDDATKKLIESQRDLLASLQLEEAALVEAAASGRDVNLVLAEFETNAIAAQTGLQGLAFDINDTRQELERLRQAGANQQFIQDLEMQNAALQIAVDTGREFNDVLEELAIRQQFAGDENGLARALDLSENNRQLREQLDEAQSDISTFLTRARENAQDILGDALANAFTGGFDNVLTEFSQVLLQLASQFLASEIFRLLGQLGQGGGGGGGGGGGLLSAIGGFFAGGFQTGGQFQVPGSGGPDSQLVSLMATPRETVTITPPGQSPGGMGGQMAPVVVPPPEVKVINTIDRSEITGAFDDGSGDQVLLNRISAKRGSFRSALGVTG